MSIKLKKLLKESYDRNAYAHTEEKLPDGTPVTVNWVDIDYQDVRTRIDAHDYEVAVYGYDEYGNEWGASVEMTDREMAADPEYAELMDRDNFKSPKTGGTPVKEQELQPGVGRRSINSDAYLVTLRNDVSGKNQLEMIRKSLGGEYIIKARGRHHNRKELLGTKYKPGSNNDVPIDQAEFIGVYLYPKQ